VPSENSRCRNPDIRRSRKSTPIQAATSLSLTEDEDVLQWQRFASANEDETDGRHLFFELSYRHLVNFFDHDSRVFPAIFNERDAAIGFQRSADFLHDFVGMAEFVVHVDEQHEVNSTDRQMRIGFVRPDDLHVRDLLGSGSLPQSAESDLPSTHGWRSRQRPAPLERRKVTLSGR